MKKIKPDFSLLTFFILSCFSANNSFAHGLTVEVEQVDSFCFVQVSLKNHTAEPMNLGYSSYLAKGKLDESLFDIKSNGVEVEYKGMFVDYIDAEWANSEKVILSQSEAVLSKINICENYNIMSLDSEFSIRFHDNVIVNGEHVVVESNIIEVTR